jgi:hypothetical protein
MISKYHTIRFVLDEAANKDPDSIDWTVWFTKVSRMFNHKIPEALLQGLLRLNLLCVNTLCEHHRGLNHRFVYNHDLKMDRFHTWIKRRDEGNKRAAEQRKRVADAKRAAEIEASIKQQEDEYKKKLPIWEKQYADLIAKRNTSNPWAQTTITRQTDEEQIDHVKLDKAG